jgi:Mg2+-importing ATPase
MPFDFERRRISVLADDGNARFLVVKGAPEEILRLSVDFEDDSVRVPSTATRGHACSDGWTRWATKAFGCSAWR